MKIQILKIGKPAYDAYGDIAAMYAKRLKPVWKIEEVIVKAAATAERAGQDVFSRLGWSASGQKTDPQHLVVALDERGRELSSPDLAGWIQTKFDDSFAKQVTFVIGGPYGLHEDLRRQADLVWCLSKGVFPSDMAWVMVWEQIYRASTIIRRIPYHHI